MAVSEKPSASWEDYQAFVNQLRSRPTLLPFQCYALLDLEAEVLETDPSLNKPPEAQETHHILDSLLSSWEAGDRVPALVYFLQRADQAYSVQRPSDVRFWLTCIYALVHPDPIEPLFTLKRSKWFTKTSRELLTNPENVDSSFEVAVEGIKRNLKAVGRPSESNLNLLQQFEEMCEGRYNATPAPELLKRVHTRMSNRSRLSIVDVGHLLKMELHLLENTSETDSNSTTNEETASENYLIEMLCLGVDQWGYDFTPAMTYLSFKLLEHSGTTANPHLATLYYRCLERLITMPFFLGEERVDWNSIYDQAIAYWQHAPVDEDLELLQTTHDLGAISEIMVALLRYNKTLNRPHKRVKAHFHHYPKDVVRALTYFKKVINKHAPGLALETTPPAPQPAQTPQQLLVSYSNHASIDRLQPNPRLVPTNIGLKPRS
jgi:hypothetical protein